MYLSYSFIDKDPILYQLMTIIKDSGLGWSKVSELSGVSESTIHNWFFGKTKKPQHASIMAVTRALGYDMVFVKGDRRVKVPPSELKKSNVVRFKKKKAA